MDEIFTCCRLCCLHNILFTTNFTKKIWSISLLSRCYVFIQPFIFHHRIYTLLQTHKKFVELHFRMAWRQGASIHSNSKFTSTISFESWRVCKGSRCFLTDIFSGFISIKGRLVFFMTSKQEFFDFHQCPMAYERNPFKVE